LAGSLVLSLHDLHTEMQAAPADGSRMLEAIQSSTIGVAKRVTVHPADHLLNLWRLLTTAASTRITLDRLAAFVEVPGATTCERAAGYFVASLNHRVYPLTVS
jgi:hypothetical protein